MTNSNKEKNELIWNEEIGWHCPYCNKKPTFICTISVDEHKYRCSCGKALINKVLVRGLVND